MSHRLVLFMVLLAFTLTGCNLGRNTDTDTTLNTPFATFDPGGIPEVTIISPNDGDEFVVGDPILINVSATDGVGVTNIQLFANGGVVRSVASESPSGDLNRTALLDYTPNRQGRVEFRVIALRGNVQSEPAEIAVEVRSNVALVTATSQQQPNIPIIDPNDPTCRALINTGLNFRQGPSTQFNVIRLLGAGEVLPIVGRLANESWWQLQSGTTIGWVDQRFITRYGNCAQIPVQTTPTATAQATATPNPTATPPPATAGPTATPQLANLVISNISGPTTVTIPAGESSVTQTYNITVTNRGGPITRQFSNAVRILPVGSYMDAGVVANLSAGQSIILTVPVTFGTTGTFALEATADIDDDIQESDTGDNTRILTITIQQESE